MTVALDSVSADDPTSGEIGSLTSKDHNDCAVDEENISPPEVDEGSSPSAGEGIQGQEEASPTEESPAENEQEKKEAKRPKTGIPRDQVQSKIKDLHAANVIPIILDNTKVLESLFAHEGRLVHIPKGMIGAQMKGMSEEEEIALVSEELRASYVHTCKHGGTLTYCFGVAFTTKWKALCSVEKQGFNPDLILDLSVCRTREALAQVIKPEEDFVDDVEAAAVAPSFVIPAPDFQMCILFNINKHEQIPVIKSDLKAAFGAKVLSQKFEFVEVDYSDSKV